MFKILFFLFFFSQLYLPVFGQSGAGYKAYSLGGGMGTTTAFGNTKTLVNKNAYNVNFNFYYTPFFSFSIDAQEGQLAGGSAHDFSGRAFVNQYTAIIFHVDLQTGEYVDYHNSPALNFTKNIYYGIGVGVINNHITEIQLVIPRTDGKAFYPYYQQRSNLVIPLRGGYDLKIFNAYDEPNLRMDFSFSFNTVFGDGLDGYKYYSNLKFYAYFAVGIKYCVGPVHLYKKPIDFTHF